MPQHAAQEPDALDMWFTRQRKAWWKKWRWAVITAVSLCVFLLLAGLASTAILAYHRVFGSAQWFHSVTSYFWWRIHAEPYLTFVFLGIALLIGFAESKVAIPSAEIALSQSNIRVFCHLSKFSKQRIWFWILLFYTVPRIVSFAGFGLKYLVFDYSGPFLPTCYYAIYQSIALSYFAVEALALLLRMTVSVRSITWLLLTPLLAVYTIDVLVDIIMMAVMRSMSDSLGEAAVSASNIVLPIASAVIFAIALIFAFSKLKPPAEFRGTYEA